MDAQTYQHMQPVCRHFVSLLSWNKTVGWLHDTSTCEHMDARTHVRTYGHTYEHTCASLGLRTALSKAILTMFTLRSMACTTAPYSSACREWEAGQVRDTPSAIHGESLIHTVQLPSAPPPLKMENIYTQKRVSYTSLQWRIMWERV